MKEWYITTPIPNVTSGYEDDAISDYAQSNFNDVMETMFSDSVTLLNYDLSVQKEIKCVIQGKTADTQLKTMERQILCPIGTIKAGMYIFYHNNYWLVTGMPDNNKSYEKSTLDLCQYKIRWQNSKGEIIDRWCAASSSSKYGKGESGNNIIILTEDSITLKLPNDDESLLLGDKSVINKRRVFIDKKQIPNKVYEITREDDVLYDYGENGGILSFIANKTEMNATTDNQELRICNYIAPTLPPPPIDETVVLSSTISGSQTLKVGYPKTYSVIFMDKSGVEKTDVVFTWNIVSEFTNEIVSTVNGQNITLRISNEDYVDENFKLQAVVDGVVNSELAITVTGLF